MTPEVLTFIRDVGFPIAMVIYLLTRLEPRQERSERVIQAQVSSIVTALNGVRVAMREIRRAQLLYVQAHPAMSNDVKQIAVRMLEEAERDEQEATSSSPPVPPVPAP